MLSSSLDSAREYADLALSVYVEGLAASRRVLFVGDSASAVPERLSSVARSVEVVQPRSRVRGTKRGVRIAPRPWPAATEGSSWDLVIVPDLNALGPLSPSRITELAGWLTARGALVAAVEPRQDGLDYEAFYELMSTEFAHVRMLGQAPFAGFTVVDFEDGQGDLEVTFDGSLLGGRGETPARFVALCGASERRLDPYSVIQIPALESRVAAEKPVDVRAPSDELRALRVELAEARTAEGDAQIREAELRRKLQSVRSRLEDAERARDEAGREVERRVRELEAARGERARADALERELESLEKRLSSAGHEITEMRVEIERRAVVTRDLIERLRDASNAPASDPPSPSGPSDAPPAVVSSELERSLAEARARAVDAEARVAAARFENDELRSELEHTRRAADEQREAVEAIERELREVRARTSALEEQRDQLEAARTLSRDDLTVERSRTLELTRQLAEAEDRVAYELSRMRTAISEADAAKLRALRGERDGIRLRLLNAEAALRGVHVAGTVRLEESAPALAHPAAEPLQERLSEEPELRTRILAREATIARVSSALNEQMDRLSARERELAERDRVIEALREEMGHARAVAEVRVDELQRELDEQRTRMTALETDSLRNSREHDDTRHALAEARQILASIATGFGDFDDAPTSGVMASPHAQRPDQDVLARTREGLEAAMKEISAGQGAEAADRLAGLLRVLRSHSA